jgi:hemoglobin/transferrin/lactoferrin receptor protein
VVTLSAEAGAARYRDIVTQQVTVVTDRAIAQRTTAVLAQAADEEAGIALQRTSPTIGAVIVRGLTEVGVYIDGVRYTNSTQRGGINTFFNLNDPTGLATMEVLRGPNTAQYGSDSLGGTVHLLTRRPQFRSTQPETHGEINAFFNSADVSAGSNAALSYGTKRFGAFVNVSGRRINTLRPGGSEDSHSAITRFLGLPSTVTGSDRLPDTAFTQYNGTTKITFLPAPNQQVTLHYQRGQQDGGKRYDQLLGGDGNLVADLRNLMLDFFYGRYSIKRTGFIDNLSVTASGNIQREERVNQGGNGNPQAAITHDKERTKSFGLSFYIDKLVANRHSLLVGGDLYHDKVEAPSYSYDPVTGSVTSVRPRVPNGARYILAGIYLQDALDLAGNRVRISGALRYNVGSYRSRASNSPVVDSLPLFPDDSLRVGDFSGRIGAVIRLASGLSSAINYSRGFRAPNITSLGSTGLVGVGYQVATTDVIGMGATIGTSADDSARSTGVRVEPLRSEISDNYELSLRFGNKRVQTDIAGFVIAYGNTIVRQTLILPPGAVGKHLGSQAIETQNANGAVYVALSSNPVLVQANFGSTRLFGIDYTLSLQLRGPWSLGGQYSYSRAEDRATGAPPNLGGGGMPPQTGHVQLRYAPVGQRLWIEAYATLAGRQDRLSSLDLSDRRTGATRSRTNIQNFFRRGACVYGLTTPGTDGRCGSSGGILIATGESLSQVQNRVLGSASSAPLFSAIPGYGLVGIRAGFRLGERQEVAIDIRNLADKNHRAPGWGIDGPGRSLTIHYGYRF